MPLVEWNERVSIKVQKFDDQHKRLVNLVNFFHDEIEAGRGDAALGIVLPALIRFAGDHHADEEKAMQASAYPEFVEHKAEHEKLDQELARLQEKYLSGSPMVPVMTMNLLRNWLVDHILGADKELGRFLNGKGIF